MGFVKLCGLFVRIDEVEQLGPVYMLQHEAVVSGRCERMHEGHDVGMADVLKIEVNLRQAERQRADDTP